jgi:hypothetical protein
VPDWILEKTPSIYRNNKNGPEFGLKKVDFIFVFFIIL